MMSISETLKEEGSGLSFTVRFTFLVHYCLEKQRTIMVLVLLGQWFACLMKNTNFRMLLVRSFSNLFILGFFFFWRLISLTIEGEDGFVVNGKTDVSKINRSLTELKGNIILLSSIVLIFRSNDQCQPPIPWRSLSHDWNGFLSGNLRTLLRCYASRYSITFYFFLSFVLLQFLSLLLHSFVFRC